MKTIVALGLITLLGAGLTACGQKGPLYLPQDAPAKEQKDDKSGK